MDEELTFFNDSSPKKENDEKSILVVRLKTSYWHNGDEFNIKRTLKTLRRKSKGYNIFYEDCHMIGAKEVFDRITNLDKCEDGIYEVVTCNEFGSWETPHIIEDYDYKLIEYKE